MSKSELIHIASEFGIPYVDVSTPAPGAVVIRAERPRNIHPASWNTWVWMFGTWLREFVPLGVHLEFVADYCEEEA